jgi:TonB family protein
MKSIIAGVILTLSSSILFGQTEYEQVIHVNKDAKTIEAYHVRKDQKTIKEGQYIFKYKNQTQVEGYYYNNEKVGEWIYTPARNFSIVGQYQKGLKDGEWVYEKDKKVVSLLNYSMGVLDGVQRGYYKDGSLASEIHYNNGELDGTASYFYESGQLKEIIHYKNGAYHGEDILYSKNEKVISKLVYHEDTPVSLEVMNEDHELLAYTGDLKNGNGCLKSLSSKDGKRVVVQERNIKDSLLNGKTIRRNEKGKMRFKGQYENGYMVGTWTYYNYRGKKDRTRVYRLSDRIKNDTKEDMVSNLNKVFVNVNELPAYGGGKPEDFQYFLLDAIQYPSICEENGIKGKVFVTFNVNNVGMIEGVKVVRSVDPYLDKEAMKVISSSPLWTPGLMDRIPVKVSFTVPINFDFR